MAVAAISVKAKFDFSLYFSYQKLLCSAILSSVSFFVAALSDDLGGNSLGVASLEGHVHMKSNAKA